MFLACKGGIAGSVPGFWAVFRAGTGQVLRPHGWRLVLTGPSTMLSSGETCSNGLFRENRRMSLSGDEFGGTVERHSGWLVPAVVFLVTACLSALVLAYYFARGPARLGQESASPTDSPL